MIGEPLWCLYCGNVSIHTADEYVKIYVCDDCYEKNKEEYEKQRKTKSDKKAKGTYNRYRHGGRKGER